MNSRDPRIKSEDDREVGKDDKSVWGGMARSGTKIAEVIKTYPLKMHKNL